MTHLTLVDWDSQELRTVSADVERRGLSAALCTSSSWDAAEQQGLTAGSFEAVQYVLQQAGIARGNGILLARRQYLESLSFVAPPSNDDELPEIVENHLDAELGMGSENAVHDYATLDEDPAAPRRVTITAMDRVAADQYRRLAETLRWNRSRLTVRGSGVFALAHKLLPDPDQPTLVVVANLEELDLAVVAEGRLVYWRNVYCSPPGDSASFRNFLTAEVVRTLAVVEESLGAGQHVERVAAFLGAAEDNALVESLQGAVELPVVRLAPELPGVALTSSDGAPLAGRFAPLLGALADEAAGKRPVVDLFNRRLVAKKRTPRTTWIFGGVAAFVAVLLGGYVLWEEVTTAESLVAKMTADLKGLEATIKKNRPDATTWEAIQTWHLANIVWLDELRDLSIRFPPPGEAVLLDFSATPNNAGGAAIRMSGKARDPNVVTALDQALRDENRSVLSRNLREQAVAVDDPFLWRFESTITAKRRPASDYLQASQAAATKSETSISQEATP